MMATTHAAAGVLLVAPLLAVAPALAAPAACAAFLGGLFPDLDVLAAHRRTLHDPLYYWLAAAPATAVAALAPAPVPVGVAAFLAAAALHCGMDAFGGGLALRPWEADDDRGVYSHRRGRWIRPRRWISYDGAPDDLALAVGLTVPGLLLYGGPVRALLLVGLVASACYTLLRKRLPDLLPSLFGVE